MSLRLIKAPSDLQLIPAESGRYYTSPSQKNWVQYLPNQQLHDIPLQFVVKLDGKFIGAQSQYGLEGIQPFFTQWENGVEAKYLIIPRCPATAFGRVWCYDPMVVHAKPDVSVSDRELETVYSLIASTVVLHGIKSHPKGMSGIAVPDTRLPTI